MTVDQNFLNHYFGTVWYRKNGSLDQYGKTGIALVNKINPGESVIDVGCGTNPFKGLITNLVGVDPAFDQADYKCTIEDFTTSDRFDVAFCLGSINFGDSTDIENQITKIISLLKPNGRIYWRCNPGLKDHKSEECKDINFYPWSMEEHIRFSNMFNAQLIECTWDTNNRIYAEWKLY
jgi:SAM-dependent methyltransferase